ncbi:MAG TPA: RsmG family class I SAM-dependent methyltransferase [Candidatus Eisenbacteria bacterium]
MPHLQKLEGDVEAIIERLKLYMLKVILWNRGISNLVSRNDEPRFVERHLMESLEPASWLRASGARRWLDVGSGAGLPAIPLILAGVGKEWTLVEARRNKTLFLIKTIQDMMLSGVTVTCDRYEHLASDPQLDGRFEGLTARAALALSPTLQTASKLVAPGGHAFLWKGSRLDEEPRSDEGWRRYWSEGGVVRVGKGPIRVVLFNRKTTD